MIRRHSLDYEGKPLWMGAAVVGVIGVGVAFIAWRLVRRHAAANGVTVMPIWFIQLFGVLLLVGLCFVSYHRGTMLVIKDKTGKKVGEIPATAPNADAYVTEQARVYGEISVDYVDYADYVPNRNAGLLSLLRQAR